jgi:hypothetical protein
MTSKNASLENPDKKRKEVNPTGTKINLFGKNRKRKAKRITQRANW